MELGPTGRNVAAMVRRFRTGLGMSQADLAKQMGLSRSAVQAIETGARRVDVDDLLALAVALNVTPNALLLEPREAREPAQTTAAEDYTSLDVWAWARGMGPLELAARVAHNLSSLDSNERYAVQEFMRRVTPINVAEAEDLAAYLDLQGAAPMPPEEAHRRDAERVTVEEVAFMRERSTAAAEQAEDRPRYQK